MCSSTLRVREPRNRRPDTGWCRGGSRVTTLRSPDRVLRMIASASEFLTFSVALGIFTLSFRVIQLIKCGWYRGENLCIGKSEEARVTGRQFFEIRVLSSYHLLALCAMADFGPPPFFSPTNSESDEANPEGVTIIHGEISCPVVGFEIFPCHIHVCVDPDPDTTTAVSPPLPD